MKYFAIFLLFSSVAFSQSKQDAVDYVNYFFNGENTFAKYSGGFKINNFNKSISFNQTYVMANPVSGEVKATDDISFMFYPDNILDVKIDSKNFDGELDIKFILIFKEPIFYSSVLKVSGESPTIDKKDKLQVNVMIHKEFPDSELDNFKKAVNLFLKQN